MNKIYVQPEMVIRNVMIEKIIAVSGQTSSDPASVDGDGNLNNETKYERPAVYNVWDDDWSE